MVLVSFRSLWTPIGLLAIILASSPAPTGLSANVIAEFTCTTNRVIRESYREIYLCYQGYPRVLSQNLPVPPIGLFTTVVAKFTYIIRVIYECYRRIYLYHQ